MAMSSPQRSKEQAKRTYGKSRLAPQNKQLKSEDPDAENFNEFEKRCKGILTGDNLTELSSFKDFIVGIQEILSKTDNTNEEQEGTSPKPISQVTSTPKRTYKDYLNRSRKCCRYLNFDCLEDICLSQPLVHHSQGQVNLMKVICSWPVPFEFILDSDKYFYIENCPTIVCLTFQSVFPSPCNPPVTTHKLFCTTLSKSSVKNLQFSVKSVSPVNLYSHSVLYKFFKEFLKCFSVKCENDFVVLNLFNNSKTIVRVKPVKSVSETNLKLHEKATSFQNTQQLSRVQENAKVSFQDSFKNFIVEKPVTEKSNYLESILPNPIKQIVYSAPSRVQNDDVGGNISIQPSALSSTNIITTQKIQEMSAIDEKLLFKKPVAKASVNNQNSITTLMGPFNDRTYESILKQSVPINLSKKQSYEIQTHSRSNNCQLNYPTFQRPLRHHPYPVEGSVYRNHSMTKFTSVNVIKSAKNEITYSSESLLAQSIGPCMVFDSFTNLRSKPNVKLTTSNLQFISTHINNKTTEIKLISSATKSLSHSNVAQKQNNKINGPMPGNFTLNSHVRNVQSQINKPVNDFISAAPVKKTCPNNNQHQHNAIRVQPPSQTFTFRELHSKNPATRNINNCKRKINTSPTQKNNAFAERSKNILEGMVKALTDEPKNKCLSKDANESLEPSGGNSNIQPEKINNSGFVEVTFYQNVPERCFNSKLVTYVPQNITIKSRINKICPNAILTAVISNDTGDIQNCSALLNLRKILNFEELENYFSAENDSQVEVKIAHSSSNLVLKKQLFMFQNYKNNTKIEQNLAERLKRSNDTCLPSGTYLLIPARKSSVPEMDIFEKKRKITKSIADIKKEIEKCYNISDDFVSTEELLKIPDEEFLCSNVKMSDIF